MASAHPVQPAYAVLAAWRKSRDETSWTQLIAAVAGSDPAFASALATLLIDRSPCGESAGLQVPPVLRCRAEVTLSNSKRIDLEFRNDPGTFVLLVEVKLWADYHGDQLAHYARELAVRDAPQSALLAVTAFSPSGSERSVEGDPRWLGSVRWAALYDELRELPVADAVGQQLWRSALAILRDQGDFGPMKLERGALDAWASLQQTEQQIRELLDQLRRPADAALTAQLAGRFNEPSFARAKHAVTRSSHRRYVAYRIPAASNDERLWLQMISIPERGGTCFTVEVRFNHAEDLVAHDPGTARATAALMAVDDGFEHGLDADGHYWSRVYPLDEFWPQDAEPSELANRLIKLVEESIAQFAGSGLFEALDARRKAVGASAAKDAG